MAIIKYELDFRPIMSSFDFPTMESVSDQLDNIFPNQEFVLQELRGYLRGVFSIFPTNEIDLANAPEATFPVRVRFSSDIETVSVRVRRVTHTGTRSHRSQRSEGGDDTTDHDNTDDMFSGRRHKEGTLITIQNCFISPEHKALTGEDFDSAFEREGFTVIKACETQLHRECRRPNGNRYLVVETDAAQSIPDNIEVINKTTETAFHFKLRYRGQQWQCRRCNVKHTGSCPSLQRFYAARKMKQQQQIATKIVADSTLRHTDDVGLKADVACVPGGTIGDMLNAVIDDPSTQHMSNVIILGGVNEIYDQKGLLPKDADYEHSIVSSVDKMKKIVDTYPTLHLTYVSPILEDTLPPDVWVRHRVIDNIFGNLPPHPQITYVDMAMAKIDLEDDGIHPTVAGTSALLDALQERTKLPLISDREFTTNVVKYQGTGQASRWGCRSCWTSGSFYTGRCDQCAANAMKHIPQEMYKARSDYNLANPGLATTDPPPGGDGGEGPSDDKTLDQYVDHLVEQSMEIDELYAKRLSETSSDEESPTKLDVLKHFSVEQVNKLATSLKSQQGKKKVKALDKKKKILFNKAAHLLGTPKLDEEDEEDV